MAQDDSLGSASWIGAGAYEAGGDFDQRATTFLATVKWDALASISSGLRDGIPCHFTDKFSIGHFNMVRRIVFDDGVSWVARVRMPELGAVFGERELLSVASTLRVEVASMKFIKYVSAFGYFRLSGDEVILTVLKEPRPPSPF